MYSTSNRRTSKELGVGDVGLGYWDRLRRKRRKVSEEDKGGGEGSVHFINVFVYTNTNNNSEFMIKGCV